MAAMAWQKRGPEGHHPSSIIQRPSSIACAWPAEQDGVGGLAADVPVPVCTVCLAPCFTARTVIVLLQVWYGMLRVLVTIQWINTLWWPWDRRRDTVAHSCRDNYSYTNNTRTSTLEEHSPFIHRPIREKSPVACPQKRQGAPSSPFVPHGSAYLRVLISPPHYSAIKVSHLLARGLGLLCVTRRKSKHGHPALPNCRCTTEAEFIAWQVPSPGA